MYNAYNTKLVKKYSYTYFVRVRLLPPIGLEHRSTRPMPGVLTARPRNQWRVYEKNAYM